MRIVVALVSIVLLFTGCGTVETEGKLNVVASTTMLHDLVEVIGDGVVECESLCGVGIDPHSYKATAGDIARMTNADVVVYNGLNLEGKMGEVFSSLESQGKDIVCIETGIDSESLLIEEGEFDPHVWFDVAIWKEVAVYVANELANIDAENATLYQQNLDEYLLELEELELYVMARVEEVAINQRVLITAHDAFNYFGTAYGFEVMGLQGVNTQTEASTADIIELSNFIVENQIKAIFVETSVPTKNIEALQEAVKSKGFEVVIGGELYSDSLGEGDSYIDTVTANIDTIVESLR